MIQIEKEVLLLEALVAPIPRVVYDSVIKYNDIDELFRVFEQRQRARVKAISGIVPQYSDMSTTLKNVSEGIVADLSSRSTIQLVIVIAFLQLFRRLSSEAMTEMEEDQLLMMKPHLLKINKHRLSIEAKQGLTKSTDGKLELNRIKDKVRHHMVVLYPDTKSDLSIAAFKKMDRRTPDSMVAHATMNQEWRTMFAAQDSVQVIIITKTSSSVYLII